LNILQKNHSAWFPISISGYHMREAGASAVQEVALQWQTRGVYRGNDPKGIPSEALALSFVSFSSGMDFLRNCQI
jgi:hypothetical protein